MLLKLSLLFIPLVILIGCGDGVPKPQMQEKEVPKKAVGIWNSKSDASLSQTEYDKVIKVYVDKKYPEKVEAYHKEIIRQAKIEKERQAKIEKERQAKIERQTKIERQATVSINGLMWQDNKEAKTIRRSFENAKKHCRNLSFAGFNDWRLPSLVELLRIVDKSRKPTIDKKFKNISSSGYWSSTSNADDSNNAWYVGFNYGFSDNCNKNDNGYVRCVRGGQ